MNEDRLEHALRNPFVRLLAILTTLFFLGWLIYGLRTVLTPVFISFLIAYLLDPVVDRFEARGINRTLAILILMVLLFLGAATFILAIALAIRDFTMVVKTDLPNWLDSTLLPWLNSAALPWVSSTFELELGSDGEADIVGGMIAEIRGHLTDFVPRLAGPVRTIVTSALSGTVALLVWVANAILIPLFSFYLLRDFDGIVARIRSLVPRQYESQVVEIFGEINETISAFVRGQMLVMLILGVLYGIGLTIAQVKLGFGIGLIAGLLAVIPYLGFFAGISMALIMSLAGGDNIWWNIIGTGITFGVVPVARGHDHHAQDRRRQGRAPPRVGDLGVDGGRPAVGGPGHAAGHPGRSGAPDRDQAGGGPLRAERALPPRRGRGGRGRQRPRRGRGGRGRQRPRRGRAWASRGRRPRGRG